MGKEDEKPNVDRMIDANLRRVYDSVLQEEVPDRFTDLLRRLQSEDVPAGDGNGKEGADAAADRAEGE